MDCEDHFLTIHFFAFIYAGNEPKSMLARDLGDCRDNLRNSRSVFLIVLFFRPYPRFDSKPRIIPDPFFRHCASLLCQNDHCRTTEGKIAFLFAALYTSRRSGIFIYNLSDHHRADLHLQQCAEICGLQQRVGSRIFFIDRAKIIRRRIDRVEHTLNPPFRRADAVIHKEIPVIIVHGKPKQK